MHDQPRSSGPPCPRCGHPTSTAVMPGELWCGWCGRQVSLSKPSVKRKSASSPTRVSKDPPARLPSPSAGISYYHLASLLDARLLGSATTRTHDVLVQGLSLLQDKLSQRAIEVLEPEALGVENCSSIFIALAQAYAMKEADPDVYIPLIHALLRRVRPHLAPDLYSEQGMHVLSTLLHHLVAQQSYVFHEGARAVAKGERASTEMGVSSRRADILATALTAAGISRTRSDEKVAAFAAAMIVCRAANISQNQATQVADTTHAVRSQMLTLCRAWIVMTTPIAKELEYLASRCTNAKARDRAETVINEYSTMAIYCLQRLQEALCSAGDNLPVGSEVSELERRWSTGIDLYWSAACALGLSEHQWVQDIRALVSGAIRNPKEARSLTKKRRLSWAWPTVCVVQLGLLFVLGSIRPGSIVHGILAWTFSISAIVTVLAHMWVRGMEPRGMAEARVYIESRVIRDAGVVDVSVSPYPVAGLCIEVT